MRSLFATILLIPLLLTGAMAQEVIRIAAIVNDEVVSALDVSRRMEMVLVSTGLRDTPETRQRLRQQVLRSLIDERLQTQEAKRRNIAVTEEELESATHMVEQQNNIPAGRMDEVLQRSGIEKETFLSQLRAEIAWTKLIRARLVPTIVISDEEIESTLARIKASAGQSEDLVSEIFLSVDSPEQEEDIRRTAARLVEQIRAGASFSAVARQFSQGTTAAAGGDIGWIQPGTLPEEVHTALRDLNRGQVSDPIRAAGGFYIMGLRDRRTFAGGDPNAGRVTLKQVMLPMAANAGQQEVDSQLALARSISESLNGCDDVDRVAKELNSRESGSLGTVRLGDLPPIFRDAVADLAVGKPTAPLRTERGVHVLVVCERLDQQAAGPNPEQIRQGLVNQRASMLARRYLRDLRRDAIVDIR